MLITYFSDQNCPITYAHVNSQNFEVGNQFPEIPRSVKVYFNQNAKTKEEIPNFYMFLLYEDIKTEFQRILQRWYLNREDYIPVINLLFDSYLRIEKPIENQFLDIAFAIESYHRRNRNNKIISSAKHRTRLSEITSTIPKQHKNWLNDKLAFSNEPSFHDRIGALINELSDHSVNYFAQGSLQFIRDVKNNRNYYTHYDKKLEKKAFKGAELFRLKDKLKLLLICILFIDLDITPDIINKFINKKLRS